MEIFNVVIALITYIYIYTQVLPTVSAIQIMHKWNSALTW